MLKKARVNQRGIVGFLALQRDRAPAFGSAQGHVQGISVTQVHFAVVVINNARTQRELDVWFFCAALGFEKALRFRYVRSDPAAAFISPLENRLQQNPASA